MKIELQTLPQSEVELTLEVAPAEYQKFLVSAAQKISQTVKIDGFRPGFAPYDIVSKKVGEAEIMNEALSEIITHTFVDAINEKKLNTLGQPEIN
ncbi:MAG TPA: trigger factor family protein, partial [Patescibacteria group bacterium]|nr:trigger factor family protein [Patescibacteria group bacterium]